MTTALTNTLYALTGKYSLDEIYTEELNQLVKEYPFFAPAQIALAAKYKSLGHENTQSQIQKAGLYVSNTKWLQFQLMDLSSISFTKQETKISNAHLFPHIHIPTMEDVKQLMGDNKIVEEPIKQEKIELPIEASIIPEPSYVSFTEENKVAKENTMSQVLEPINAAKKEVEEEADLEPLEAESSITHPINDIHSQIAKLKEQWNKPVEATEKLSFEAEPYYTIDYFESQGIKFDYKNNANDDLTKKMLKFTDWLKRMKNPNANIANQPQEYSEELDKAIQGIAQASNQPKEIVTETMAEVFEKQGNIEKAIQLYIKLSFLNPTKTAFFAARIQKLKGIE
jgi:hypothetical protein